MLNDHLLSTGGKALGFKVSEVRGKRSRGTREGAGSWLVTLMGSGERWPRRTAYTLSFSNENFIEVGLQKERN